MESFSIILRVIFHLTVKEMSRASCMSLFPCLPHRDLTSLKRISCQPWPMSLLVKVNNEKDLKRWTPASDFTVLLNGFPRLVVEVCSNPNRADNIQARLLVYGASVVRLANHILKTKGKRKSFVLVAIYITDEGRAEFSLLYEDDHSPEVSESV